MKNETEITFHSGLDTIGGVIMELRYNDDRVFFEAGTAYDPAYDLNDPAIQQRTSYLSDQLWTHAIPKIDGIYRRQDIQAVPDLIAAEDMKIRHQAFFISHLHLDHMQMMGLIAPQIDVYLTRPAQKLEKALEEVGLGVETIRGMKYTDMKEDVQIGAIHVHRFLLNEASYQDLSFYIETPDLKIHYTGDVFLYAPYGENIHKEIAYLQEKEIDLLVCEGTRFSSEKSYDRKILPSLEPKGGLLSKQQLDERILGIIRKQDGLVVFNYYEREMSDALFFLEAAESCGRTIVFEPESAHLINAFFDRKVHVLVPDTYEQKPDYLDAVLSDNILISKEEIRKDPHHYLLQNSYPNALELLDYADCRTLYLHHSGVPLGDFDPKLANLKRILALGKISYCHAYQGEDGYFSPHAEDYQILAYINAVHARLTVPCHTMNRKAMAACIALPVFLAEQKKTYVYDRENNTLKEIGHE